MLSRAGVSVLFLWFLLASPHVLGDTSGDWEKTFAVAAVNGTLPDDVNGVLVAQAGAPSEDLVAAGKALVGALRACGRAMLVMSDEGLGDLSPLEDAAIVSKAAHLPITHVVIVRVFAAQVGQPAMAVVTLYTRGGEAVVAVAAQAGTAIAPGMVASGGTGVTRRAAESVGVLTEQNKTTLKQAREEYEQNYVGFPEIVAVSGSSGQALDEWTTPFLGKYRKPLSVVEFYEAVGRTDLVDRYNSRRATELTLMIGGGVVAVAAAVYAFYSVANSPYSQCVDRNLLRHRDEEEDCDRLDDGEGKLSAGLIVSGIALLAGLVGSGINPHPVTASEAREIADQHNQKLKLKLGLGEAQARPAKQHRFRLGALPFASYKGGGVLLSLSF